MQSNNEEKNKKFARGLAKELTSFTAGSRTPRKDVIYKTFGYEITKNSDGFRSPEFTQKTDILYAGCSYTFGTGLPENFIWGSMLAKEQGMSYNAIGIEGGSCMDIVFNIFKYFEKYGHPKMVLALLPDFYRVYTYLDGKVLNTTRMFHYLKSSEDNIFTNDAGPGNSQKTLKFLSLPTSTENVYSKEFVYMLNSFYIKMLEIYCKSHNIPFIWTKWWDDPMDQLLSLDDFPNVNITSANEELKKYSAYYNTEFVHDNCHHEYRELLNDDPTLWSVAKDDLHNGVHWQIHVKEIFESVLKQKELIP